MTPRQQAALLYKWSFWARPQQLPPAGDWRVWLVLAGRGFGKTRTGAEWLRWKVETGQARRVALVARTAPDARDVMIEGESGLLSISPPWFRPKYEPSKRRLTWPNGAMATAFSAEEPDLLRGPQHDAAWCDELAAWKYADAFDMLMFGLRLGDNPQVIATTTPRPVKLIRDLLADRYTHVTRGSTYDNVVNLAPAFKEQIIAKYEGTRLGRQELYAEVLDDVPGALWKRAMFDTRKSAQDLARVVVAIDPAVSTGEDSAETGIVVAGKGADGLYYVLDDRSCRLSPDGWARRAVAALDEYRADRLIAEVNNGGDMVQAVLKTIRPQLPFRAVHASRGKAIRAEPIAALYEQGRVFHVKPLDALEDQLCNWTPESGEKSPDRMDALVWALTELSTKATREIRAW